MQDEERDLKGCTSLRRMMVLTLQLLSSSSKQMAPYLRKTEGTFLRHCSQGKGRIWREQLRSLTRTERAGLVDDCGSVLRVDLVALA